jgi:hypothetical protein
MMRLHLMELHLMGLHLLGLHCRERLPCEGVFRTIAITAFDNLGVGVCLSATYTRPGHGCRTRYDLCNQRDIVFKLPVGGPGEVLDTFSWLFPLEISVARKDSEIEVL